jgi:hypothetical protein
MEVKRHSITPDRPHLAFQNDVKRREIVKRNKPITRNYGEELKVRRFRVSHLKDENSDHKRVEKKDRAKRTAQRYELNAQMARSLLPGKIVKEKGQGELGGEKKRYSPLIRKNVNLRKRLKHPLNRTKKSIDAVTVKPLQGVLMQLEGKRQDQMENIGGEATMFGSSIVAGLLNAAVAVVKLAILITSLLSTLVSVIVGAVSATALMVLVVVVVIVVIIIAVTMANPAIGEDADAIYSLKFTCDMAISQKINDDWTNLFPLHTKVDLSYNATEANNANYAEAIALARLLSNDDAINPSQLSSIVLMLNEIEYNAQNATTLKIGINQVEHSAEVYQNLFNENEKAFNAAELHDLAIMYREALDQIQGNRYDLNLSIPSLIVSWEYPFDVSGGITKEYGEESDEKGEHWLTILFDDVIPFKSISRGIIVHISLDNKEMRIQYQSGAVLELNGDLLIDPSLVIGRLVSSGDYLFDVEGTISMKLVMPSENVPDDAVKDTETGKEIRVPSRVVDNSRSSVHPLLFVQYHIAKYKGQDGLRQRIIEEAKTYLGVPYILGGHTRSSLDCSGFTMIVFNKITAGTPYATNFSHGSIAQDTLLQGRGAVFEHIYSCWIRDSMSQDERNKKMQADLALLKVGDLLFFWGNDAYKKSSLNTHVGIYIGVNPVTGKHEFIHATSYAGKVVINEMTSYFHWPGRARRPIWD